MYNTNQNNSLANYRTSAYARGQMGQGSSFSGRKDYYPRTESKTESQFVSNLKGLLYGILNAPVKLWTAKSTQSN
jgi:hypothetical protein